LLGERLDVGTLRRPARLRHTGPLHGGTGLAPIRDFMLVPIGKSSAGDLPKF
jgi:hypothetical protein